MKAYIEIVVLDNMILTSVISALSYSALGLKPKKRRIAVVAFLCTVISVVSPFFCLPLALMIVIKVVIGVVAAVGLFFNCGRLFLGVLSFFGFTAFTGGLAIYINYLITGSFNSVYGEAIIPYCVCSAVSALLYFFFKMCLAALKKTREESSLSVKVSVTLCGVTMTLSGFIDTGNGLYDENSGLPIVVAKLSALTERVGYHRLKKAVTGRKTVEVLGKEKKQLFLLKADKFVLYSDKKSNIHKDVMIGISVGGFTRKEDLLLGIGLLGGNNVKMA